MHPLRASQSAPHNSSVSINDEIITMFSIGAISWPSSLSVVLSHMNYTHSAQMFIDSAWSMMWVYSLQVSCLFTKYLLICCPPNSLCLGHVKTFHSLTFWSFPLVPDPFQQHPFQLLLHPNMHPPRTGADPTMGTCLWLQEKKLQWYFFCEQLPMKKICFQF